MIKLFRSKKNRIIAGVCGGIGEYADIDPVIVRILFVLLSFGGGSGTLLYIILLIIMPEQGEEEEVKKSEAEKKDSNSK